MLRRNSFNFLGFCLPGFEYLRHIVGDFTLEFGVIHLHYRFLRDDLKHLVSEISAQSFNKLELTSFRVSLILALHVFDLFKDFSKSYIDSCEVISRKKLIYWQFTQHTVVSLCCLQATIQFNIMFKHQDKLVLICTFKEIKSHGDLRLSDLLLNMSERSFKRNVKHYFLKHTPASEVVFHLSDTTYVLDPLFDPIF